MMKRILSLLLAVFLLTCSAALAETPLYDPVAIVSYDRSFMQDWTPCYGLNVPGVLLELSHPEALLTVTALDMDDAQSPDAHLEYRLDRAGETLIVSNAYVDSWSDPFDGDGRFLSFSYTYPDGDEEHLCCIWVASHGGDTLLELVVDAWGADAQSLVDSARAAFVDSESSIKIYEKASAATATLTDVTEDDEGRVQIQLTDEASGARSYRLSSDAVLLFPNPDDPSLFYPVGADMSSLVDAILVYEESSDSQPVFRAILVNNSIIYMEYDLMR